MALRVLRGWQLFAGRDGRAVIGGEDVQEIGLMLRAAREAKDMSIEALYVKTKIRPHIIMAIEAGEFERVSVGSVYLHGFIRTLSNELGVDYTHLPWPEAATLTSPDDLPSVTRERIVHVPWRRWIGALIMLVALISAGLFYLYWSSPPLPPSERVPEATLPPVEQPVTPTLPDPLLPPLPVWVLRQSEGIHDLYEVKEWPMELTVRVRTESCWLAVTIDGVRTSQTLTAGNSATFRANQSMSLRLGRARVVDIVLNGSPLPAQTGHVRDYTFVKPRQ